MRREVAHLTGDAEYCRRLDAELLEKMRRCADLEQQRHRREEASAHRQAEADRECHEIAAALNIRNLQLARSLQMLGYTPTTAPLVFLAPLVWIAWADGAVGRAERRIILDLAHLRGLAADAPGYSHLLAALERRPAQQVIEKCWSAVRVILDALPAEESAAKKDCILHACRAVAAVSGGPILHRICAAERDLLKRIEDDLQTPCAAALAGFP